MTATIKGMAVFMMSCACLFAGCASDSAPQTKNIIPPAVEKTAQGLTADLTAQGFQVSRGLSIILCKWFFRSFIKQAFCLQT